MNEIKPVDILLVEDNPQDLELAQRALRKANLADRIQIARDGAEALDFVFCRGAFAGRKAPVRDGDEGGSCAGRQVHG